MAHSTRAREAGADDRQADRWIRTETPWRTGRYWPVGERRLGALRPRRGAGDPSARLGQLREVRVVERARARPRATPRG